MSNIENRHKMGQEIFFYLGAYAPAFGMLGTVMGLIIMMNNFLWIMAHLYIKQDVKILFSFVYMELETLAEVVKR